MLVDEGPRVGAACGVGPRTSRICSRARPSGEGQYVEKLIKQGDTTVFVAKHEIVKTSCYGVVEEMNSWIRLVMRRRHQKVVDVPSETIALN